MIPQNILDAIVQIEGPLLLEPVMLNDMKPDAEAVKARQALRGPIGLGILCGDYVITCAHFTGFFPSTLFDLHMYRATKVTNGVCGDFALYMATSMDVTVLAANGLHVGSDDGGPTDSAYNVILDYSNDHDVPLRPATVSFSNKCRSAKFNGYYFDKDGRTYHRTEFEVNPSNELISFYSEINMPGRSGGPILTEDMKIIGVVSAMASHKAENGLYHYYGRRIDLSVPVLFKDQIDWDFVEF